MFEREFNRAKTKAIGLLLKETDLGEAKIAYLESLSKQSIDSEIDFKNLVKKNILKKGIRLGKLIEIEYAKHILKEYINHKHTYLSDVEKEVCLAKSIKKMYHLIMILLKMKIWNIVKLVFLEKLEKMMMLGLKVEKL